MYWRRVVVDYNDFMGTERGNLKHVVTIFLFESPYVSFRVSERHIGFTFIYFLDCPAVEMYECFFESLMAAFNSRTTVLRRALYNLSITFTDPDIIYHLKEESEKLYQASQNKKKD